MTEYLERTYLVIMAGGVGSRLWPMSSPENPKQTQHLLTERSLLRQTIDRALLLLPAERIFILTGPTMISAITEQASGIPSEHILVEPSGKNTAPAIALALLHAQKNHASHLIVWPCDHYIHDESNWIDIHKEALLVSQECDAVLIGITPTHPATGYGYIQHKAGSVRAFHEKPTLQRAEQLLDLNSLWNAGVCIGRTDSFFQLFQQFLPMCIASDMLSHWDSLPSISMDYGILEKATSLRVIPYQKGWSDLGDWDSIIEHLPLLETHRCHPKADVISLDSSGCGVVVQRHMNVAFVDVEDVIVVCTNTQLLVMKRGCGQSVRGISDRFGVSNNS